MVHKVLSATLLFCALAAISVGQSTTGDILGIVYDASGGVVADARVTVRNTETNAAKNATSSSEGAFRIPLLPAGQYEITVEKAGFAKYVQRGITLSLNQHADLRINLEVSGTAEVVNILDEAPIINTTNAEIGTSFDTRRIAELPIAPTRNISNLALQLPGVTQVGGGQTGFSSSGNTGTDGSASYSANGMRLRSNNFVVDGQDSNSPSVSGLLQPINNPEIVAEVRVITNQFAPEYGRAAGSVMNIITKSGSNQFHGSAFWFHNNNKLNTLSNTDKAARFTQAPWRIENQAGGTFGGPVIRNRTFFFAGLQRWTDRRLGSGSTINGAPTEEGRRILTGLAGTRPQLRALLENLPAGASNGRTAQVIADGQTFQVPLGDITGAARIRFDDWQYNWRIDHRFSDNHVLSGRYLVDDSTSAGAGQATPTGLTNFNPAATYSLTVNLNSSLRTNVFNELRTSYNRQSSLTNASDPAVAERIPSLEVAGLGLRGFNAVATRTALGLAVNLPQSGVFNNYQLQDNVSIVHGSHSMKFGIDFRRQEQFSLFNPTVRGRLEYANLQRLVDDQATIAQINIPLPGVPEKQYYRYYDYFFFVQDEWRLHPSFSLSYGVRYESPGNPIANLAAVNERVVRAFNDERFRLTPVPPRDNNNWAPRLGFNWRVPKGSGVLGLLTGDGNLVLRGGYSRTYDLIFNNIALNIGSAFPFVSVYDIPSASVRPPDSTTNLTLRPNAFASVAQVRGGFLPAIANPLLITRTTVGADFRAPLAEQVALQIQRELPGGWAFTTGYVGTKGTALFQTVDGNPTVPGTNGARRVDPARGVIRERCNCTSSSYHSLQTSLEKRLSSSFMMAAHYTWSSFIDGASEIFNPSNSGEIAVPQDSFNRDADRARSSYDRPHRFVANGVWDLPFFRGRPGAVRHILAGWQVNGFLTLQSGAPFSALMGADPGGRVLGINGLVGTPIRPNLNTDLDLSGMSVREVQRAGGAALFAPVTAANPIGNLGRNVLRSDGINRVDLGVFKNFRIAEGHRVQFQANFFNLTNTRNYGIPEAVFTAPAFLNEGANDAGNRRIQMALRYTF